MPSAGPSYVAALCCSGLRVRSKVSTETGGMACAGAVSPKERPQCGQTIASNWLITLESSTLFSPQFLH